MEAVWNYLFPPTPTLAEKTAAWRQQMLREQRKMDMEIRKIEQAEIGVRKSIKEAAKRDDSVSTRILATELVRSRKAKERLYAAKAHMNSVIMSIRTAAGTCICLCQSQQEPTVPANSDGKDGAINGSEHGNHDIHEQACQGTVCVAVSRLPRHLMCSERRFPN